MLKVEFEEFFDELLDAAENEEERIVLNIINDIFRKIKLKYKGKVHPDDIDEIVENYL